MKSIAKMHHHAIYPMSVLAIAVAGTLAGCTSTTPAANRTQPRALERLPALYVSSESGAHRYRIDVPISSHGYLRGQWMALYGTIPGTDDIRAVGLGQARASGERTLFVDAELVVGFTNGSRPPKRLQAMTMPANPHIGKEVASVLEHEQGQNTVRINVSAADGVVVGDEYVVLGEPLSSTDLGGTTLGREPIALIQVSEVEPDKLYARARIVDDVGQTGRVPTSAWLLHRGTSDTPLGNTIEVRVLVARFGGDDGKRHAMTLCRSLADLGRALCEPASMQHNATSSNKPRSSVTVQFLDQSLESMLGPYNDTTPIVRLGRQYGADIVLWGNALQHRGTLIIKPRVTFVHAARDAEFTRWWGGDTDIEVTPALMRTRIAGIAGRIAGLAHFQRFDYARASLYLERATLHSDQPSDVLAARLALQRCYSYTSRWREAMETARHIVTDGERHGHLWRQAYGLYAMAEMSTWTGDHERAIEHAQHAIRLAEKDNASSIAARAWGQIAEVRYQRGKLDEALRIRAKRQLPVFQKLGDSRLEAFTWGYIADIWYQQGKLDEALSIWEDRQLPVFQKLGDIRSEAVTWGRIADIWYRRGKLDEALRIRAKRQLPVFQKLGDIRSVAVTWGYIADIWYAQGKLDEALRIREKRELPVYQKLGDIRSEAVTWGQIADIWHRRGKLDEALRIRAKRQLPVYQKLGDIRSEAVIWGQIADIWYAQGKLDEALRIRAKRELPVYQKLGDIRSEAVTWGYIADIFAREGKLDEAITIYKQKVLPVSIKLQERRAILIVRTMLAQIYWMRNRADDRARAATLVRQALTDARAMRLPESAQIEQLMKKKGIPLKP